MSGSHGHQHAIVGGILAGSLSLIAEALHNIGDAVSSASPSRSHGGHRMRP